jgi:predicted amidohydrolase YtcJ
MVLPAFQDAHAHPLDGGLSALHCDLYEIWGRERYGRAIADYAAANPEREWVYGAGWAMDAFPGGTPHRRELDELVRDRPALLVNRDFHGAWANSRALELAGITTETPDPRDGRIERDPDGRPSGTLHEGAMELVRRLLPETSREDRIEGLRRGQARLHALGIGAWNEASVTDAELDAYRALDDGGELTGRVVLSLLWRRDRGEEQLDDLEQLRAAGCVGRTSASTVKIFQDGVAENFTAAMLEPYLDASGASSGNRGISMIEPDALWRYVTLLDRAGFQVHFHAIGDRAVREALDAVAAARASNGARDARHHIAHIQVIHPDDIARFRALDVVANGQPFWAQEDPQMRDLTIPFLGPVRAGWQYPFASLRRAGAVLAFGSDWPVSTPDPLLEIEVAVTRRSPDGSAAPFLPAERLDLPAALDAFTIGAAYVNRFDDNTGSIEVGKLADIAVVDRDLFDPGLDHLSDARVVLTLVEGKVVFSDGSLW